MSYALNISGFVDFHIYHKDGSPIYLYGGKLVAGYDLAVRIGTKYKFLSRNTQEQVEQAIQENLYMFDVVESNKFYYPNTNMFSMSNAVQGLKGSVLTLKEKYRF